jgi:hypothetical protein
MPTCKECNTVFYSNKGLVDHTYDNDDVGDRLKITRYREKLKELRRR